MEILEIELNKYKRFFLNNINNLTFTPDKKITLILGTNGSGKSSLIKELSPLPANIKKDYEEDGYRKITIRHKNSIYKIIDGEKYSFIKDDVELNTSGNKRVQLTLVKEHFNYTEDIHNILIGVNSFTKMSGMERKSWLTNISHIDYDYAIAFFKRLTTRERDIRGAIKILSNKLLEDETLLLSKDIKDKYLEDIKTLDSLLEFLFSKKESVNLKDLDYENIANTLNDKNDKLRNSLKLKISISELNNLLNKHNNRLEYLNKCIKDLENTLEELNRLNDLKSNDIEYIVKEIKDLENNKIKLETILPLKLNLDNIVNIFNDFNDNYNELIDLILAIIERKNNILDNEIYSNKVKLLASLTKKIIEVSDSLISINTKLEDIELNKDIKAECEKCGHIFNPFYKDIEKEDLLKKKSLLESNKKLLIENEIKLKEEIKQHEEVLFFIEKFHNVFKFNKDIMNYILNIADIKVNPIIIRDEVIYFRNTLESLLEYKDFSIKIEKLNNDLKILELSKGIMDKTNSKEKIELELSNYLLEKNKLIKDIEIINSDIEVSNNIIKLTNVMEMFLLDYKRNKDNLFNKEKNNILDEVIMKIKNDKHTLEDKIKNSDILENNIKSMRDKINSLENTSKALKKAIKALSPNEGLIANSIISFLSVFVEEMNYIINSIWSYDIKVLPCNLDNDELDYKFPVLVDNRNTVEDISKTSASMQEIIDLAFKITSMKFLGLDDFPLFLDEFGRTMDMGHRVKSYNIIDNLAVNTFSQIFIVSHFENVYNRFSNSDTVVLSSLNIELDNKEVNKVLKII